MNNDPVFRVVATAAVFAAYVLLLAPLAGLVGGGALFLAIVPVLVAGWLDGLLMGLAMGLYRGPHRGAHPCRQRQPRHHQLR